VEHARVGRRRGLELDGGLVGENLHPVGLKPVEREAHDAGGAPSALPSVFAPAPHATSLIAAEDFARENGPVHASQAVPVGAGQRRGRPARQGQNKPDLRPVVPQALSSGICHRGFKALARCPRRRNMAVMGVSRFERFFRAAAGLDIDKNDIRRHSEFVNDKLYDLLVVAQATAKADGRDIIRLSDLPITKGLQESIHQFRKLDQEVEVEPILETLANHPPLDRTPDEETESKYPEIIGGLSLALARAFKIMHPDLANPQTKHWDEARAIFDLLL
jgi:hypothetical protein